MTEDEEGLCSYPQSTEINWRHVSWYWRLDDWIAYHRLVVPRCPWQEAGNINAVSLFLTKALTEVRAIF
jgi:hypothetical protein